MNESTGFTPFELVFGQNCRTILDIYRDSLSAQKAIDPPVDYAVYIQKLRRVMQQLSRRAVANKTRLSRREKREPTSDLIATSIRWAIRSCF